jgi:hypothetical protein
MIDEQERHLISQLPNGLMRVIEFRRPVTGTITIQIAGYSIASSQERGSNN